MGVIGIILGNLRNMRRAKKLRAMPRAELLAMDDEAFYDAMECITEDAVYEISDPALNREQILAYTLIKLETEVNNGGLCQFFVNSSRQCVPYVSEALEAVGALGIRELFDSFVRGNGIDVQDLSSFQISRVEEFEEQTKRFDFDVFDDRFYEDSALHQQIIDFLRKHAEQIVK